MKYTFIFLIVTMILVSGCTSTNVEKIVPTTTTQQCVPNFIKDPTPIPKGTCGAVCFKDYNTQTYYEESYVQGFVWCNCDVNDCGVIPPTTTTINTGSQNIEREKALDNACHIFNADNCNTDLNSVKVDYEEAGTSCFNKPSRECSLTELCNMQGLTQEECSRRCGCQ